MESCRGLVSKVKNRSVRSLCEVIFGTVGNHQLFGLVSRASDTVVLHGSYLVSVTNETIDGQNFISVIFPAKSDFTQLRMPRYAMLE